MNQSVKCQYVFWKKKHFLKYFHEPLFKMIEKQEAEGIRMIPYQSVGREHGMMPAVMANDMKNHERGPDNRTQKGSDRHIQSIPFQMGSLRNVTTSGSDQKWEVMIVLKLSLVSGRRTFFWKRK